VPDPLTPTKSLIQPTVDGDDDVWGIVLNETLDLIDSALGATLTLSISGTTILGGSQIENTGYKFTGSLSGGAIIEWPSFFGLAAIQNATSGGHSISCGVSDGSFITVLSGEIVAIWSDGTNFYRLAQAGGGIGATGSGNVVLANSPTISSPTFSGIVAGLAASDLSNGTIGSGAVVLAEALTVPKTAGYAIANGDSGKFFNNIGATGEVDFALPVAAAGLHFYFIVEAAQTVKVIAGTGATISIGTATSASAGNVTSNFPYSALHVVAISTTEWVAASSTGEWIVT
jgi:hypothetical protein